MLLGVLLLGGALLSPAMAAELTVAVATNFAAAAKALESVYETGSGNQVTLVLGSSGKLATQVRQGAPFDVLLSADAARPHRLEADGFAVPGSRFTYAEGTLALWSPAAVLSDGPAYLHEARFRHLAIANPDLAPYGLAARQTLQALELWQALEPRIARAENVGQVQAMVASGAAQAGFIAASAVPGGAGSVWLVPGELHDPILQQAVVTRRGRDNPAARDFLAFLRDEVAVAIIVAHGYRVPGVAALGAR